MDKAGLLQLPGRPEEQDWLRERLEVLTAREGIALDAAIQRHPAQDSTEVVSLLASLDEYEVLGGIQSYEDLGLYYLEETNARLLALRDYIDLDKLGRQYEAQHPGRFAGGCYVVYPRKGVTGFYDGVNLPGPDYSWSLRLKLASSAVPEGVAGAAGLQRHHGREAGGDPAGPGRSGCADHPGVHPAGGPVQPAWDHRLGGCI
ncbi:MAG: hypothetical protein ACLRNV_14330 [Flavonifractor plautii]